MSEGFMVNRTEGLGLGDWASPEVETIGFHGYEIWDVVAQRWWPLTKYVLKTRGLVYERNGREETMLAAKTNQIRCDGAEIEVDWEAEGLTADAAAQKLAHHIKDFEAKFWGRLGGKA